MVVKLKLLQFKEVLNIPEVAGNQVIHAYYMVAFGNKSIAEVRTQKSCCTGYQYPFPAHVAGYVIFKNEGYTTLVNTNKLLHSYLFCHYSAANALIIKSLAGHTIQVKQVASVKHHPLLQAFAYAVKIRGSKLTPFGSNN